MESHNIGGRFLPQTDRVRERLVLNEWHPNQFSKLKIIGAAKVKRNYRLH